MRDEKTYAIIGAAIEVHKELGCEFLEAVYQEALDKKYQPDFVCYGEIIIEIKAISGLSGIEEAKLINYLKDSGLKVGLLINFDSRSLEHKRFVYNL